MHVCRPNPDSNRTVYTLAERFASGFAIFLLTLCPLKSNMSIPAANFSGSIPQRRDGSASDNSGDLNNNNDDDDDYASVDANGGQPAAAMATAAAKATKTALRCTAVLELVNEDGNQLSTDQMLLPSLLTWFAIAWLGIIVLWLANWLLWRKVGVCQFN